jgi:AraC-like DNA-binding protein
LAVADQSQSLSDVDGTFHRKNRVESKELHGRIVAMNDFERIAKIIRYIDGHHRQQPTLEVLAARIGLSRFHFHRLFSNWAGITPKDFLQCLTLAHAKKLLKKGENILHASLDSACLAQGDYTTCV